MWDVLWNAGAYLLVAVLAHFIILGIRRVAPAGSLHDDGAGGQPTLLASLGLTWRHAGANIALGLTLFIWLTPAVLCLHAVLSIILWDRPHALAGLPTAEFGPAEWVLVGCQACLVVPAIEEILFRGLLQSWLRRTSLLGHFALAAATLTRAAFGVAYHDTAADVDVLDISPVIFAVILVSGYVYALYRLQQRFQLSPAEVRAWKPRAIDLPPEGIFFETTTIVREQQARRERDWRRLTSFVAVYGSAMLFAILHVDAWPAPIALFVLGLGLGALARNTQSLIAPIVLHATFNLVAFIALVGTSVQAQPAASISLPLAYGSRLVLP